MFHDPKIPPFGFVDTLPHYQATTNNGARLNLRYRYIVEPFLKDLNGAKVLDLAAHDGRWSYALSYAGAAQVDGIEGRADLIEKFSSYPEGPIKDRVTLHQGDIFQRLDELIAAGESYDVIAVYGIYYHITEHYRLLLQLRALSPKLIIIDSEFRTAPDAPVIWYMFEATDNPMNTIKRGSGQNREFVACPTIKWMNKASDLLGYDTQWQDWTTLPKTDRARVPEYFRTSKPKQRRTVALRRR